MELKTIKDYIYEQCAPLNTFEKDVARDVLNQLHNQGYSDAWIAIALYRILKKGNLSQWKYLLFYKPFIEENNRCLEFWNDTSIESKKHDLEFCVLRRKDKCTNWTEEEWDYVEDFINYGYEIDEITDDENIDLLKLEEFVDYVYIKYFFLYGNDALMFYL